MLLVSIVLLAIFLFFQLLYIFIPLFSTKSFSPMNTTQIEKGMTILIPAFNEEKTILNCLQGIVNVSYKNYEVIVVNDCSKDNSLKIVEEYQKQHKNLKILNNEKNLNVAESRNKGVREAKGEWIAFLDADDKWTENKLVIY